MLFKQYLQQIKQANAYAHSLIVQTTKCVDHRQLALDYLKTLTCTQTNGFCNQCTSCQRIEQQNYLDFIFFDNLDGSLTKEMVLSLQEKFSLPANENANIKLYVIVNLELVNKQLLNSLLKFIEEPPAHTYALFFSQNANLILKTITSRSQIITIQDSHSFDVDNHELKQVLPLIFNDINQYNEFTATEDLVALYALANQSIKHPSISEIGNILNTIKDLSKAAFVTWLKCVIALAEPQHKVQLTPLLNQLKLNVNRKTLGFKILDILGA